MHKLLLPLRIFGLRAAGFWQETRGSMTVEGAIVLPIWIWAYIASYQFFDAFRDQSESMRAAYTISDALSRQITAVGPDYIDGLDDVFEYMTRSDDTTWIRVTSVYWDATNSVYRQFWSYATDGHNAHTDETIKLQAARLPNMITGETVVLVESFMEYNPTFNVGLDTMWYDNFVATRPRFASKVEYNENY